DVTFWCMEIVPVCTPRIGASKSPVVRPASHQPSCHARTPRDDHSSANCWRYPAARRGIAPSEWLTRYVQVSTIGNSRRQAMRASDINSRFAVGGSQFAVRGSRFATELHIQIDPHTLDLRVVVGGGGAYLAAEHALF